MISLVVNGKNCELEAPTPLNDYLRRAGLADRRIAVAVNGVVLRKEEFEGTLLQQDDRVEIVRPVGGG